MHFYVPVQQQPCIMTLSAPASCLFIMVIVAVLLLVCGCTQPQSAQGAGSAAVPALNMSVPFAPVPVASENGINLAYEIALAPPAGMVPVVEKVEVIDASTGKTLYTEDAGLLASTYHPASVPPPTPAELQEGTGKLLTPRISVWFVVSPDAIPDQLTHRITLNRSAEGLPPLVLSGANVIVRKDLAPVVIGAPFSGPGWLAMETTSPLTHHFGGQITVGNVTRVPQRYAQDWIYVDPVTGMASSGNATLARDYYGFGKEIHAVANGTVISAQDGLPDLETIYSARPAAFATLAGNNVIEAIGNGKYACYGHMENGSVRVQAGDTVTEGQVIGLMGNSGNSDLPHLHFQVVTGAPSFLGAEGYPHVYRSFSVIGDVNVTRVEEQQQADPAFVFNRLWSEFGNFTDFYAQPVAQQDKLVENNAIVQFP